MRELNSLMVVKNNEVKTQKAYLNVNVILTFVSADEHGRNQEIFDLSLPLSKKEINAALFIHQKLFKRIVKKCERLNRSVGDLIKISTCGNWDVFTTFTGFTSLPDLGHSCKWFFGNGRSDLNAWEKVLIRDFGFGVDADMSHITAQWIAETNAMIDKCKTSINKKTATSNL